MGDRLEMYALEDVTTHKRLDDSCSQSPVFILQFSACCSLTQCDLIKMHTYVTVHVCALYVRRYLCTCVLILQFKNEEIAEKAVMALNNRWYNGKSFGIHSYIRMCFCMY